jgi:hypothetical protein
LSRSNRIAAAVVVVVGASRARGNPHPITTTPVVNTTNAKIDRHRKLGPVGRWVDMREGLTETSSRDKRLESPAGS